jgi:hypothetical protein
MKKLPRKYMVLILLFTAVITVVCRYGSPFEHQTMYGQTCFFEGTVNTEGMLKEGRYDCTSPDGSMMICPYTGKPVKDSSLNAWEHDLKTQIDTDENTFWTAYECYPLTATPTQTLVPTPYPTDTPTPTPPPALLTGEITACSRKDGFLNLKLANTNRQAVIWIAINGKTATCTVAGTNRDVLSCALPPGITFPITISAADNFVPTDFFEYDGSDCTAAVPDRPNDSPDAPPSGDGLGD